MAATNNAKKTHVKRSPNCFMLFAAVMRKRIKQAREEAGETPLAQSELSKIISEMWANEPPDQRLFWERLAEEKKAEHAAANPDYKYTPRTKEQKEADIAEKKRQRDEEREQKKAARKGRRYDPRTSTYPTAAQLGVSTTPSFQMPPAVTALDHPAAASSSSDVLVPPSNTPQAVSPPYSLSSPPQDWASVFQSPSPPTTTSSGSNSAGSRFQSIEPQPVAGPSRVPSNGTTFDFSATQSWSQDQFSWPEQPVAGPSTLPSNYELPGSSLNSYGHLNNTYEINSDQGPLLTEFGNPLDISFTGNDPTSFDLGPLALTDFSSVSLDQMMAPFDGAMPSLDDMFSAQPNFDIGIFNNMGPTNGMQDPFAAPAPEPAQAPHQPYVPPGGARNVGVRRVAASWVNRRFAQEDVPASAS